MSKQKPVERSNQTPASILRAEFRDALLAQIGGEPLETSGFEHEQYELEFGPGEEDERYA